MIKVTNFNKSIASIIAVFFLLVGCGQSVPEEIKPQPEGDSTITASPVGARPQWFWQPAWWEREGTLAQETIELIQQNTSVLQTIRQLDSVAVGGTGRQLNYSQGYSFWNAQQSLQYVSIPFVGGSTTEYVQFYIRPVWYFFGAHWHGIEDAAYVKSVRLQPNSGITIQSSNLYPAIANALQNGIVNSRIVISSTGVIQGAVSTTFDVAARRVVSTTVSDRKDLTPAQIRVFTVSSPLALQAVIVVPCNPISNPFNPNIPYCPNPNGNPDQQPVVNVNGDGNPEFNKEPLSGFPTVIDSFDQYNNSKPDCTSLRQTVDDARHEYQVAVSDTQTASATYFVGCASIGIGVAAPWTLLLSVPGCAAAWKNYETRLKDQQYKLDKLLSAKKTYESNCPRK